MTSINMEQLALLPSAADRPWQQPPLQQPLPMVAAPGLRMKCMACLLISISVGFVACVIETEEWFKFMRATPAGHDWGNQTAAETERQTSNWVCHAIKWLFSIVSIAAVAYLHCVVLARGDGVPETCVKSRQSGQQIILTGVRRHVEILERVSSIPSDLFIGTYIIFFIAFLVSSVMDIIGAAFGLSHEAGIPAGCEIARRCVLLASKLAQTMLFIVHFKKSIQWKLEVSWWCMAQILAANIADWFFTVGLEVREIGTASELSPGAPNISFDAVLRFLYPFTIEYYVMSSLMAFTMMRNIGRLGAFLRETLRDCVRDEGEFLDTYKSMVQTGASGSHARMRSGISEIAALQRNPCGFMIGLCAIVTAIVVSVIVRFLGSTDDGAIHMTDLVFQGTLVITYTCGIVCVILLLRLLSTGASSGGKCHLTQTHISDRALLWLGAAAIVINDMYTFIRTWTRMSSLQKLPPNEYRMPYYSLLITSCALNITQSLLQVFALECALVHKFRSDRGGNHAVLNALIMLNFAQWIINAVCFEFFIPKGQMEDALVLSLLTLPLQVFYRFHSAACVHEFKRHCRPEAAMQEADQIEPVRVNFESLMRMHGEEN